MGLTVQDSFTQETDYLISYAESTNMLKSNRDKIVTEEEFLKLLEKEFPEYLL